MVEYIKPDDFVLNDQHDINNVGNLIISGYQLLFITIIKHKTYPMRIGSNVLRKVVA